MRINFVLLLFLAASLFLVGCDKPAEKVKTTTAKAPSQKMENPCSAAALNPCSLEGKGKALWSDTSLGMNDRSCTSCHAGGALLKLDLAFPHFVKMPNKEVTLPEMINYCITTPLKGKAIAVDGPKMQAMVAYYDHMAKTMPRGAANPCGMEMKQHMKGNPCAMKNPCGMEMKQHMKGNPCAMKNPCGMEMKQHMKGNPCAM